MNSDLLHGAYELEKRLRWEYLCMVKGVGSMHHVCDDNCKVVDRKTIHSSNNLYLLNGLCCSDNVDKVRHS